MIYIALSYTVRIPIFRLVDLYHVTLGYDATTSCPPVTVITPWLRLTQSLTIFVCSVFNLNNKNVNALIARELSGFTCTRSLTMNSKFSIPHSAASCGIEISSSLLVNECR